MTMLPCHAMKTAVILAITLAACSSLDPSVGPLRIEQPVTDAGGDAPSECSEVGPDEVCFSRDIRPIIQRTRDQAIAMGVGRGCVPCHDARATLHVGTSLSGLDVSTLGELRKGGSSTGQKIIIAGNPDESLLVKALRGQFGSNRMPKGGPHHLDESLEMALITRWILEGARGKDSE